jgi:hypothetical protein
VQVHHHGAAPRRGAGFPYVGPKQHYRRIRGEVDLGHLTRSCGLSIDNLVAADVVLADGSFVTASEDANEDLFWAIRGGGGNFGVVTSFTFRAHPVHTHIAGVTLWPVERAADAMRMYRDLMADAPERLTGVFAYLVVPPGPPFPEELHLKPMCGVVWCHRGTQEESDADLAPALAFGPPAFEHIGPIPHPVLQSMFDGIAFAGMHNYWRGDFVSELSDDAIAVHVEHGARVPNPFSSMHLYPVDGVASRVGKDQTAWSYREAFAPMLRAKVEPMGAPARRPMIGSLAVHEQ